MQPRFFKKLNIFVNRSFYYYESQDELYLILLLCFFLNNRKELRHFNIGDYMEMGRVLSQVVLDYELAQENKS